MRQVKIIDFTSTYEGDGIIWTYGKAIDGCVRWVGRMYPNGPQEAVASTPVMERWLNSGRIKPIEAMKILTWESVRFRYNAARFKDFNTLEIICACGDVSPMIEGAVSEPVTLRFPSKVKV